MTIEFIDKCLSTIFLNDENKMLLIRHHRVQRYKNIYNHIKNRYNDNSDYVESLYRIIHNIKERPRCKCGNELKFYGRKFEYRHHCSQKCAHNDEEVKSRYVNTCLERYGVTNSTKCEFVQDKMKSTCLERYGVDNAWKSEEKKQKIKETCLERYGVTHHLKLQKFLDKQYETNLKRYGVKNVWQSEEVKDKIKATCLERYGAENWSCSYIGKITLSSVELQAKRIETGRINDTLGKSKEEIYILELLKTKFSDVIFQYKIDPRYPFNCDFYIPSLDLFIEYQGTWTHGGHPFNQNDINDINIVNNWKSKDPIKHSWYSGAIQNWTVTDPYKRSIAKKNNINFIEFWSIDEVRDWLSNFSI